MNLTRAHLLKSSGLASAWQRWRKHSRDRQALRALPQIHVAATNIATLAGPEDYRKTLLDLIAQARQRILIAALYLQDDDAGREVLEALYAAKRARPELDIAVFVDWHRAQRGLIGKAKSEGNAAMYKAMARRHGPGVEVYGVPVQRREFMGVLHLKGFVIDDVVLYSGASLNDVYLQRHGRYRLDRYHVIRNRTLADSMAALLTDVFRMSPAVRLLNTETTAKTVDVRGVIPGLRRQLMQSRYDFAVAEGECAPGEVGITPLLGLGARNNELNRVLLQLIRNAEKRLVLFTPYFNLPDPVRRVLDGRIKAGCQVSIVIGDKTANDFYIPPEEPFKAIGALPYLYEANLRRFCKAHQKAIDAGTLSIHLWRHDNNTFHLKGLLVDDDYALITGNNINPRAWRLDLENGLLIHDPQKLLLAQHVAELEGILQHTRRLAHHSALDSVNDYPLPVQRLLKRLSRIRADRLVNRML
ncbi:CDP-diacylglycerol--serine O-phosphatidyltransferase [Propionivibrio limicola]|uniref:CDP-diacylglycerol--serine O-phosphatidyltransferase n=1 Tax=Propionivibrio limicola TaxID=167645 RepID=UPI001B884EB0|nr:CDP-diacylglycerol--serine O-phosphatidyltransferase [Propionivibrio limicola]